MEKVIIMKASHETQIQKLYETTAESYSALMDNEIRPPMFSDTPSTGIGSRSWG